MPKKLTTVAELYAEYQRVKDEAKALYDQADKLQSRLVRAWKKNRDARVDEGHVLEVTDKFRGVTKAFAPGFAHRYDLKLKAVEPSA